MAMNDIGGYVGVQLVLPIPEGYRCPYCRLLIRNPVQTIDGERLCRSCVINIDSSTEIFTDKLAEREIQNLVCYCQYNLRGCKWKSKLMFLEDHTKECDYQPVQCYQCLYYVAKCELEDHVKFCIQSVASCVQCEHILSLLAQHTRDCKKARCPECDVNIWQCHKGVCPGVNISCPYDCGVEISKRDVKEHCKECVLVRKGKEMSQNELPADNYGYPENPNIRAHFETMSKEENANLKEENAKLKEEIDITKTENANLKEENIRLAISLMDTERKLLSKEQHDGRLVWRIDRFLSRKNDAINGNVEALHSAPCFTERHGYKFCARLYLNGDGMGKGTHLSLFFVLMKDDFDVLQTWPFSHRVSFELIHPKNEKLSHRESFIPDKNSDSFKRPTKEMNIAAGCPKFFPIDNLHDFVIDDCIFIEIEVKKVSINRKIKELFRS